MGIGPTVAASVARWFEIPLRPASSTTWWTRASSRSGRPRSPIGGRRRRAAGGQDAGRHGHADGLRPTGRRGGDPRRGRQGGGLRVEEDRLPGRRRERRLEAGQGAGAGRAGPRRGRLPPAAGGGGSRMKLVARSSRAASVAGGRAVSRIRAQGRDECRALRPDGRRRRRPVAAQRGRGLCRDRRPLAFHCRRRDARRDEPATSSSSPPASRTGSTTSRKSCGSS